MAGVEDMRFDARTGLVELTEAECFDLLRTTNIGRLAVLLGTTPDIFPVHYRVHGREILVRTEAGSKLAAATLMPEVAFEIDGVDEAGKEGWSVVFHGRGREPASLEESVQLDEIDLEPWVDAPKSRWLLIRPSRVTGRRIVRRR
jgi:nitroimidazol reductase NimA-like FMN-containing flavoprotein (pyridoxamine 5'-phosphate oxidase superfamily)